MNLHYFLHALLDILNEMSPYILLGFIIAGILHVFIRPEVMSRHLSGRGWKPVLKAALFGIPLPLCSCGVLPTAVALRRQGASKGAATSFLIATPQTGVDSIAATYALLGLPFAIVRPIAALVGAFIGGIAVDRTDNGDSDSTTPETGNPGIHRKDERPASFIGKIIESVRYGLVDMVASVGKWLVCGLIIAAIITVSVPDSLFLSLRDYPLPAMLVTVAIAVPMYICATGSIPIAMSLMLKGLSPGVAFVLLMAGPAANFASVMVLRKSLGTKATAIYIGAVVVTAIAFGMFIDTLLPVSWFMPTGQPSVQSDCHVQMGWFETSCSVLLIGLLIYALIRNRRESRRFHSCCKQECTNNVECDTTKQNIIPMATTIYKVKGMSCNHCKATVEKAIAALPGVESVAVNLASGEVAVKGPATTEAIARAVSSVGFEFVGAVQ